MVMFLFSFDGWKLICIKLGFLFHWINPKYEYSCTIHEYIPEEHPKNKNHHHNPKRISISYEKYRNINLHMFGFQLDWGFGIQVLFNDMNILVLRHHST